MSVSMLVANEKCRACEAEKISGVDSGSSTSPRCHVRSLIIRARGFRCFQYRRVRLWTGGLIVRSSFYLCLFWAWHCKLDASSLLATHMTPPSMYEPREPKIASCRNIT